MSSIVRAVSSPTHTTKAIVREVASALSAPLSATIETTDLTLPRQRPTDVLCNADDVLVFGFPVYAGRVPVLLRDEFAHLEATRHAPRDRGAVRQPPLRRRPPGSRRPVERTGFNVVAAGAFIGEHSLTARTGRPDSADIAVAQRFGAPDGSAPCGAQRAPTIEGNRPYQELASGADVRPITTDACTNCGVCVACCPLGIIDEDDPALVDAGCLNCRACVKSCPEDAKYFSSEPTDRLIAMLESKCLERKEPQLFW